MSELRFILGVFLIVVGVLLAFKSCGKLTSAPLSMKSERSEFAWSLLTGLFGILLLAGIVLVYTS